MAGGPPTAADFELWLRPGEALERFHPGGDIAERKRGIIRRLATGQLRAAGYGEHGLVLIVAGRWRDWSVSDHSLWTIGDAYFSRGGGPIGGAILFVDGQEYNPPPPHEAISFTDVRLDPARLGHGFVSEGEAIATRKEQPAPALAPAKGGRSTGHHGIVIATLAKRLMALPEAELQAYAPHRLQSELIAEYRAHGAPSPSAENVTLIAAGILKALRN